MKVGTGGNGRLCLPVVTAATASTQAGTSGFQLVGLIQQYGTYLSVDVAMILTSLEAILLTLSGYAFVFLMILGVFLYCTRLNKRLGKELLEGAIIIGIFIALGVPYLGTVTAAC